MVAYLASAGVGWIAADPVMHRAVDPAALDTHLVPLADATSALAAAIVTATSVTAATASVVTWRPWADATLWIADGLAGALPPCPRCAGEATTRAAISADLEALRDALLGSVIATETVKILLAIGTPLAGHVLAYDPIDATVTRAASASRPDCGCARA